MESSCCCDTSKFANNKNNCILCGKPLVYFPEEREMECQVCHKMKPANAACEDGHFVCDECHSGGREMILELLKHSKEKDPIVLLHQIFKLENVHLHGPEHHGIVPCVLVTAYHNCDGKFNRAQTGDEIDDRLDFENSLLEAWNRGEKIPGGSCGFLGVCGAASGAGIFASIVSGATPLTKKQWEIPQRLTASCLEAITKIGGPRCCKRTTRIAIECAAEFCEKEFGITMPVSRPACVYWAWNNECIHHDCPFFP